MKYIICMLPLMMMISCSPQKKASRWVLKAQLKSPNTVASICADLYPPIEYVRDSIIYKEGSFLDVELISTNDSYSKREQMLASIPRVNSNSITRLRVDTLFIIREKQVENSAYVKSLTAQLKDITELKIKTESKNKIYFFIVLLLAVYTLLRWILRFYFKIRIP